MSDARAAALPAVRLLAKPTGAVCNLDRACCFLLGKEMLYPGSRVRLADELLAARPTRDGGANEPCPCSSGRK
jgi:hypothetical protein